MDADLSLQDNVRLTIQEFIGKCNGPTVRLTASQQRELARQLAAQVQEVFLDRYTTEPREASVDELRAAARHAYAYLCANMPTNLLFDPEYLQVRDNLAAGLGLPARRPNAKGVDGD